MGRKKSLISEGIQESKDVGNEGLERGEELSMESSEIRALIDSIDTDMDEDDTKMIENTKEGYSGAFSEAFEGESLEKQNDMEKIGEEQIEQANEEIEKVSQAADIYSNMEGISDVGSEFANEAADAMDSSKTEYEEMAEDARDVLEEYKNRFAELERERDSVFG